MVEPTPVPRGSYCGRCRRLIRSEEFLTFLFNDHLCPECSPVSAGEHAQKLAESEKRKAEVAA